MTNLTATATMPAPGTTMWDLLFSKAGLLAVTILVWFIASPTFRCLVLGMLFGDLFFGGDCE